MARMNDDAQRDESSDALRDQQPSWSGKGIEGGGGREGATG